MTQVQPAFWVRYRGAVDPQIPNTTTYTYQLTYTIVGNVPVNLSYACLGPPQLNRERFIDISWSPIVGLIRVVITRNTVVMFDSLGAEGGFSDQGQFNSSTTGVLA